MALKSYMLCWECDICGEELEMSYKVGAPNLFGPVDCHLPPGWRTHFAGEKKWGWPKLICSDKCVRELEEAGYAKA